MKNCPACHANYPTDYTHCPRDLTPLREAGVWSEGTVVRGRYRILGQIGAGGMATVYKAEHVHFRELRALKAIKPELASDPKFVQRFTQEAVLTRRLQHPNAVRVDDIDQAEDGRPFIVMEYIEGRSLKDVMQSEGAMPVARVCAIAKQVAAGLGAAHDLGMVHRDIKPANIVLVAQSSNNSPRPFGGEGASRIGVGEAVAPGHPIAKVLDFGIAKIKEGHLEDTRLAHMTQTGTGMVVGTPTYMSPEQAQGMKGDHLDGRSDLYSLGIVIYQMLSGDLPFKADTTMEMLIAHIQTRPRPLREARPDLDIPESIVALVMKCLEKDPGLRPSSAHQLIEEIQWAQEGLSGSLGLRAAARPGALVRDGTSRSSESTPAGAKGREALGRSRIDTDDGPSLGHRVSEAAQPRRVPTPARPSAARQHPPERVTPTSSRWGQWGLVSVTLLLLGIGLWHFSSRAGRVGTPPGAREASPLSTSGTRAAGSRAQNPSREPEAHDESRKSAEPPVQQPARTDSQLSYEAGPKASAERGVNKTRTQSLSETGVSSPRKSSASKLGGPGGTDLKSVGKLGTSKASLPPGEAPGEDANISGAIAEGQVYVSRGDYDKAISIYQGALNLHPNNKELQEKIAQAQKARDAEKNLP
jgi:serine/threonine protein kinase